MKKKKVIFLLLLSAFLITGCGKKTDTTLSQNQVQHNQEQGTVIEYVFESDNLKLCQYKGNTFNSEDPDTPPSESDIEKGFLLLIQMAETTSGVPYEPTDEWVCQAFGNIYSIDELYEEAIHVAENEKKKTYGKLNQEMCVNYVIENSIVTPTDETIEEMRIMTQDSYINGAPSRGYNSFDEYLESISYEGTSEDYFNGDEFAQQVYNDACYATIMDKIAELENLTVTDEEVQHYLEDFGDVVYTTEEEIIDAYYNGKRENVIKSMQRALAEAFILKNSTFIYEEQ